MNRKRLDGDETWSRLLNWTKGQKSSERLSAHILRADGYKSIDPSHPLGGRDGVKDMIAIKENIKWIAASYFPRGQKGFKDIKNKFIQDLKGIQNNDVRGLAFITNQEISVSERKQLKELGKPHTIEVFHLERIASSLDSPENYGIRLEFLDIEMTKEEQLAFMAYRDGKYFQLSEKIENFMIDYDNFKRSSTESFEIEEGRSLEEIQEAMDIFFDKIWYDRHMLLKYRIDNKSEKVDPQIWKNALKAEKKMEEKYGVENLGPYGDFEWGMLNGKLSALRWVLGDEWDMLDT